MAILDRIKETLKKSAKGVQQTLESRPAQPAVPRTAQPPSPTPVGTQPSMDRLREVERRIPVTGGEEPSVAPTPAPVPTPGAPPAPEATPTPIQKYEMTPQEMGREKARFAKKVPFSPTPWTPTDEGSFKNDVVSIQKTWDGSSGLPTIEGDTDDVMAAYAGITYVLKTCEHLLPQLESYDRDFYKDLERQRSGYTTATTTLNPWRAMADAANQISQEHEGRLAAYLATDEGLTDLMNRAVLGISSPPNFVEMTLLSPGETIAGPLVREFLPNHPLKEVLARFLEATLDPTFIATIPFLPGASLAAKATLYTEITAGMTAGEEAAEATGVNPLVGAIAGGVLLPSAIGLTRASLEAAARNVKLNPRPGSTPYEALRMRGDVVTGVEEIERAAGERVVHIGSTESNWMGIEATGGIPRASEASAGRLPGIYVGTEPNVAETAAKATATLEGGVAETRPFVLSPGARIATETEIEDVARAAGLRHSPKDMEKLAKLLRKQGFDAAEHGGVGRSIVVLNPKVLQPVSMSAGASGADMALMDRLIRVNIERPEARDLLRKLSEKMGQYPGTRQFVQTINRMALAESPVERAAFGRELVKTWQDAQREMTLAKFRQFGKPPFYENDIGQIWVPRAAGEAEGSWEAVGDVFESIMRGDKTYLSRLTEDQVDYVKGLQRSLAPFTAEAEGNLGVKIARRDAYWPRYALDPNKGWKIASTGAGGGRPPSLFQRHIEVMQEAIEEYGINYRPGILEQADRYIQGMQRLSRDSILGDYLRREGLLKSGGHRTLNEAFASDLGQAVPQWTREGIPMAERINKEHIREILSISGPGFGQSAPEQALIHVPRKVNSVFRLLLTGTMDTGWGAIQLVTTLGLPKASGVWAKSMAKGFYTMIADPNYYHRFVANAPAAKAFAQFGGNLGIGTEFMEAARYFGPLRRLELGFGSTLGFGRIMAFDAMAQAAARPAGIARLGARAALQGEALYDEMFRVARFSDTLLGQPALSGVVSMKQQQLESAWVFFAARYTRSFLGTLSYVAGSGYTPAVARQIMAKLLLGGMATTSGLVYGLGKAQGKSDDEIMGDIATAINPQSGKKFMSVNVGGEWYGLGGVYRSGMAMLGGLVDKETWTFEEWEDPLWDNWLTRSWRTRAAPDMGTLMDWLQGEDFMGYEVPKDFFISDPARLLQYAVDKFAPISLDAYLQSPYSWRDPRRISAAFAEFFGLRTSPESAGEALDAIREKVATDRFGASYDDLEYNTAARAWINETPQVQMVIEGRVLPIDNKRVQDEWDRYRESQNEIRNQYFEEKGTLDTCFESGRCDGKQYRDGYSEIQSNEFSALQGMQSALGIEFDPKNAPKGTVDYALAERFAVDIKEYTDPDTLAVDWEAFLAARDAPIADLSPEDQETVEWYLHRHETPLRREMRSTFGEVIEASGYFNRRETAAEGVGLDLEALQAEVSQRLIAAGKRASNQDVLNIVDGIIDGERKAVLGANAPTIAGMRNGLRQASPRLDVELYRQGYVSSVLTEEAVAIANQLAQQYPDRGYREPPLAASATQNK